MARAAATVFKGLLPLLDRRRVPEQYVLDGRNFYVSADGPISGFGKETVTSELIADPSNIQSFRIEAGARIFIFSQGVVLEYDDVSNDFIPLHTFTEPAEPFRWTHALVGGIDYFAKKGVGLLQYNTVTNLWAEITGPDVPAEIQACTSSGGRLVVAATGLSAWTAIDDGTDFAPSTVTGAGAQALSLVGALGPNDILSCVQVADGYLTLTKNGIMRSELIDAINPFRHRRMTEETDPRPINSFCIISIAKFQWIMLTLQGFFSVVAGRVEVWQPVMGEYFHSKVLPAFDLRNAPNVIRLDANLDRQWFTASIATNEISGTYQIAYMLYLPSDEWGTLNQVHTGFIELDLDTGLVPGFIFCMVDTNGLVSRFTDGPVDQLWPLIENFSYDYHVNVEYPPRTDGTTFIMPSRIRIASINEDIFEDVSGVYDLRHVLFERIAPADQDAPLDSAFPAENPSGPALTYDQEILADNPEFYFKLDDLDDNIAAPLIDSSGNGNDGQVINPSPGVSVNPLHIGSTASLYAVDVSSLPFLESSLGVLPLSGNFSTEAWINLQTLVSGSVIMSRWGTVENLFVITQIDVGGGDFRLRLSIRNSANAQFSINSSTSITAFTDYFVVLTYSAANGWRLYINAVNVGSIIQDRRTVLDATLRLNTYGDTSTVTRSNCEYDSWPLFYTELSETRVVAHYEAGIGGGAPTGAWRMPSAMKMSDGILWLVTKLEDPELASLNAQIKVGLWRFTTEENPDETSFVSDVIIGMLDADSGIGDINIDWLLDFSIDIFEDWMLIDGEEDWNGGGAAATDYTARITGANDGYNAIGRNLSVPNPMEEELTLKEQDGRTRFYTCNSNALYHFMEINAFEVNQSFVLKNMEIRGIISGRV